MDKFKKRLQTLLEERNMNQKELAKQSGVTEVTISRYINGSRKPRIEIVNKLAEVLNTTTDYLLGRTDEKNSPKDKKDPFPEEFTSPEDAVKFLLEQNVIMGFGGFDVNTMSDEEVLEFANELLNQLRILSYKYKK
ncbi:helix-turn-helix domain-containing protein [Clostridium sp. D2Q-14]|uniref:helix-turn-helix domain-containing protein n=1 Tax=Anaeromonas gelatinilytica TaxID=2683194 RepID=UPI00193B4809|nr:helix-turn-helix domain-containing protein [Anaeromonas gelatinilytica]MBS4534472.1 helix-turn-helix domain-containing protein [Anaeromonas gelatinilytica]